MNASGTSANSGPDRSRPTPGPWRWEVNRASKSIKLCGGPPNKGFGRYDLTVMEFCRYGMNKAAPVFWDWCTERFVGTPHRADALAVTVEGREHHADWFADIDHPDARLIAAAPELLDALKELHLKAVVGTDDERCAALNQAWAAIAKAEGLIT
ncbi:MAG: hypothetical protein ACT6Q7_03050 [Blastomonas fulva]|uniref:hypothetical protein n=1 Tax=Blastomonas fulva TaxID=1550728 RepID=UPI0040342F65